MKSGCRSCALAAAILSVLGLSRRKITHTSTLIWAMPVRSSAPIALHYSVSIRAWAYAKPIRQIALTPIWAKLKSSNAAFLVMLAAANLRQAPSSRNHWGGSRWADCPRKRSVDMSDQCEARCPDLSRGCYGYVVAHLISRPPALRLHRAQARMRSAASRCEPREPDQCGQQCY